MTFSKIISTKGTDLDKSLLTVTNGPMLPRGAALITRSGNLSSQNIHAIINAATGSMTTHGGIFEPTNDSVTQSIINCYDLLLVNGLSKMAVPFIGGNIFRGRIGDTKEELAKVIIDACFSVDDGSRFVFVIFDHPDYLIFKSILNSDYPKIDIETVLKQGSVTHYKDHHCDAIVNASNMEVQFGGGLAGIIGNATGAQVAIDQEAQTAITDFWKIQS